MPLYDPVTLAFNLLNLKLVRELTHIRGLISRIQLYPAFPASSMSAYRRRSLCGRAGLRSAERGDLSVPRTATELRKRSFSVAAPAIWNSPPVYLHSSSIFKGQFRRGLETHLFLYNL